MNVIRAIRTFIGGRHKNLSDGVNSVCPPLRKSMRDQVHFAFVNHA